MDGRGRGEGAQHTGTLYSPLSKEDILDVELSLIDLTTVNIVSAL